jgi:hypothetical protein
VGVLPEYEYAHGKTAGEAVGEEWAFGMREIGREDLFAHRVIGWGEGALKVSTRVVGRQPEGLGCGRAGAKLAEATGTLRISVKVPDGTGVLGKSGVFEREMRWNGGVRGWELGSEGAGGRD